MHELAIMKDILEVVLEYGEQAKAEKISRINLNVGAFTEFVPRWAQTYFNMIAENTIADKAEIHIDTIPAVIKCRSCGTETEIDIKHLLTECSKCQSKQIDLISGRQLQIDSIEIA